MPDAITLLVSDHRTVDDLFSKVEGSDAPDQAVVDRIVKELSIHDAIEKSHLYTFIRKHVDGGDDLADRSVGEHDEQARAVYKVDKSEPGSAELVENLSTLIRLVRTHVEEEETQTFPALADSVASEALHELGTKLQVAKETAPTRPHLLAPSEGLGTQVAGMLSAPLDRLKDAVQGRD